MYSKKRDQKWCEKWPAPHSPASVVQPPRPGLPAPCSRRRAEQVEDPAARLQLAEAASEQLARELLALEASLDEKLAEEAAADT